MTVRIYPMDAKEKDQVVRYIVVDELDELPTEDAGPGDLGFVKSTTSLYLRSPDLGWVPINSLPGSIPDELGRKP